MHSFPDPLLLPFLASFEGGTLEPLKVGDSLLLKWRTSEIAFQGGANALRYHQGRVLGARLTSIPFGERSAFKDEMGQLLHLSRRSIELRMQIATELDLALTEAGDTASELRRSVLDRPWRDVLAAVRLALYGPPVVDRDNDEDSFSPDDTGAGSEASGRWDHWRSSLHSLEGESGESLEDLDQWVEMLQDALLRAAERRSELEEPQEEYSSAQATARSSR